MAKGKEKESMYKLANSFFENVKFNNGVEINYSEDDYFFGKYYYSRLIEYLSIPQTLEEIKASKDFDTFIKSKYGRKLPKIRFDNIEHAEYNSEDDTIELSPHIGKFSNFLINSTLSEILFMNFLRADGLRKVHKYSTYTSLFKKVITHLETEHRIDSNLRHNFCVNVTEDQWNLVAKYEFRKEILAWEILYKTLKEDKFHYFDDFECILDEEDLSKLRQYFLFITIAKLYKNKMNKSITLFDCLTFEY